MPINAVTLVTLYHITFTFRTTQI